MQRSRLPRGELLCVEGLLEGFSQFEEFSLHVEELPLHQRSKDGHASLAVAGFVQYPVDLRLVDPQVRLTLKKPFPLRYGLLQVVIDPGGSLAGRMLVLIGIILHAFSRTLFYPQLLPCMPCGCRIDMTMNLPLEYPVGFNDRFLMKQTAGQNLERLISFLLPVCCQSSNLIECILLFKKVHSIV